MVHPQASLQDVPTPTAPAELVQRDSAAEAAVLGGSRL